MDPRDTYIQIRIKRPMSQLSVLSTVDERACVAGNGMTSLAASYGGMGHRASLPGFVPVVSLEYGLVPTSTLTPRLRGSSTPGVAATPNFCNTLHRKSSRAYRLARQLGKSRHFAGMQLGSEYLNAIMIAMNSCYWYTMITAIPSIIALAASITLL
ncbi:hypothetical protein ElyMa_003007400 [Elysia marginata]|uniref:Uncharacterized protein n=1 Tax=Elysia marginata TaxID=1093978 RepID=A0AAV4IHG8_9GAST|nr:hypothetical protein ElyMa_003007400 [Elysia marginata]